DGRLERGEITFESFPDRDEMDYRVTGHLAGVAASLPGKGRVIDAGDADVELKPDRGHLAGNFRSGQATLGLNAVLTKFADPHWTANIELAGPLAEALRFLPPQPDLEVNAGHVAAKLNAAGRFGPTTVPEVDGTVVLRGAALRHTSIAVPVDRFDCDIDLNGRTVHLRDGVVQAGRSDARFTGRIDDYTKPKLDADIQAGTIDLAELFPATGGTATTAEPRKGGASRPPVTGHITIDRMVRKEVTLTDVSSSFAIDANGMGLTNLTGHAWGGTVKGNLQLSPKGDQELDYAGDLDIQGVHAEQLLATYTPIRGLQGLLTTDIKLSGRNAPGLNPLTVLTLIGKGLVIEGSFVNLPIIRKVSEAVGYTPGMAATIPFKTIRHSIRVQNGFADLDSFTIRQDAADWRVGGRIGLDGRLDCPVTARVAVNQFRPGTRLAEFAALLADKDGRLPIAFHLGGTLTSPDVKLNLEPLLASAQKKAEQKIGDELRRRLEDLLRGRKPSGGGGTPPGGTGTPTGGSGTPTGGTPQDTAATTPPGSTTPTPVPTPVPPKPSVEDELKKRLDELLGKKPKAPPPPPPPRDTTVREPPVPPDTAAPQPPPPDTGSANPDTLSRSGSGRDST
ncbi:MAG TPA: AsmA-like C-terminal region-containing protein, partial [Candidatus Eisenbacteria bacterium]